MFFLFLFARANVVVNAHFENEKYQTRYMHDKNICHGQRETNQVLNLSKQIDQFCESPVLLF